LGTLGPIFEKSGAEIYIVHETPVDKVEKSFPLAGFGSRAALCP